MASHGTLPPEFKDSMSRNQAQVFSTVNETDRTLTPVSSPNALSGDSPIRTQNQNVSDIEVQADLDHSEASRCEVLTS